MSTDRQAHAPLFSEDWFSQLSAVLGRVEPEADWPRLDLGVLVDDAPSGPVRYTFHLGPDGAAIEIGSVDSAVVTLVESFATARAIDEGAPVSELLAGGRITIRGDASALIAAQGPLAAVSAVLKRDAGPADKPVHHGRRNGL
jgi:hypothetical protein